MGINKKIIGIIPARYGSTRFPGKPLAVVAGVTMIERVYVQAKKSKRLDEVVVATDDTRIETVVKSFGGRVVMTSDKHQSGTDRCVEALKNITGTWDIAINIQGDEPFIFPEQIDQLIQCFDDGKTDIATLVKKIGSREEIYNPNVVKVIRSKNHEALYFSRAQVPFNRTGGEDLLIPATYYKHIGIYGYRIDTLYKLAALPQSSLELTESLEQLRWMENGYRIMTAVTAYENTAIDTPEDLEGILKSMKPL